MEERNCLDVALHLAEKYGFSVFPLHGVVPQQSAQLGQIYLCACGKIECKDQGKHPATDRGFKNASHEPDVIAHMWQGKVFTNIGIATGIESNMFVVDIDGAEGYETLRSLEKKHGPLPPTLTCKTSRGEHRYFQYPSRKVHSGNHKLGHKIDVKGDGGYVVGPGSQHLSGAIYKFVDESTPISHAPAWVIDIVCESYRAPKLNKEALDRSRDLDTEWEEADVIDMLSCIDPSCDRSDWIKVGMALQAGGFSFSMFDTWSSKCAAKYNKHVTQKDWLSFEPDGGVTMGTLVHMARMNGWKPRSYIDEEPLTLDNHPARDLILKLIDGKPKHAEVIKEIGVIEKEGKEFGILPEILLSKLPGIVGDTVRWISSVSAKPQPELALLNTIAVLGALFGRRYVMNTLDTRTNIYVIGLAPTGKGKDKSRQKLKEIMTICGYDTYLGPDSVRSAAGLITSLESRISQVMMIDEFGDFFETVADENAPAHKAEIAAHFMKLYSSSSSYYTEGSYADAKKNIAPLNKPNLCIYGTSTEDTYAESMKKLAIRSGSLNRFIIVKGRDRPELNFELAESEVPDSLLEQWQNLLPPQMGNLGDLNISKTEPVVTKVAYDNWSWQRLKEIFIAENNLCDSRLFGPLWARYRENTIKIAMIFAIARNPTVPIITRDELDIAEVIVKTSVEYMVYLAKEKMYENQFEKNVKEVSAYIRAQGDDGTTKKDLLKCFTAIKLKDMEDILNQLLETAQIQSDKESNGRGRPTVVFRWCAPLFGR